MQIIGTLSSPFTRKVRIVALERGIQAEFVVDSPLSSETHVPDVNPLNKVPVLVLDDRSALIDSSLIAMHLSGLGSGPDLLDGAGVERTAVMQWDAMADGVLDAAVLLRMESLRAEQERSQWWVDRQRRKIVDGLNWIEEELDGSSFCVGNSFTLADIAVGCCVAYLKFRFANEKWTSQCPAATRLEERLEERESFQRTRFQS